MGQWFKSRLVIWVGLVALASVSAIGAPFVSDFRVCEDQVAESEVVTVCRAPNLGTVPVYLTLSFGLVLFAPEVIKLARAVRTISVELGQLKLSAELAEVKEAVESVRETASEASESVATLVEEQKWRRVEEIPSLDLGTKVEQMQQAGATGQITPSDDDRRGFIEAVQTLFATADRLESELGVSETVKEWRLIFGRELQSLSDALGAIQAGGFVPPDVLSHGKAIAIEMQRALEDRVA